MLFIPIIENVVAPSRYFQLGFVEIVCGSFCDSYTPVTDLKLFNCCMTTGCDDYQNDYNAIWSWNTIYGMLAFQWRIDYIQSY